MDMGIIEGVVNAIALRLVDATAALVPIGNAVAFSLSVLAVVMMAASALTGTLGAMLPLIFNLCLGCASTFWLMTVWPDIPLMLVHDARALIGMVTGGGYAGPTQLFELAAHAYGRIAAEPIAWGWSLGAASQAFALILAGPLVLFGLCYVGILAVLAEIALLLGGVAAPLVLCLIALPFTRSLGVGALQWMFGAMVRVVILGVTATVMADVVAGMLTIHGLEAGLTTVELCSLLLTAFLTFLIGHSANSIAGALVGGSTLGQSAFTAATTTVSTLTSRVGGAAVSTGAAAGGAASKVRSAGEAARSMAPVTRSTGNSAFGS